MMSCARARHAPLFKIEHEALQGDEHPARILLGQFVVEPAEDLVRFRELPGHVVPRSLHAKQTKTIWPSIWPAPRRCPNAGAKRVP